MTRRQFVKSSLLASLGLLTGEAMISGFQPWIVNRQRIFLRGLALAFDGIRVALLSDFHHGELVSADMRPAATIFCVVGHYPALRDQSPGPISAWI
jgi:hypothetical protein